MRDNFRLGGERAAVLAGDAVEREPFVTVISPRQDEPRGSVVSGWRYFSPPSPPLHLVERREDA